MTYEEAKAAAVQFWDGLYSVRLHREDIWRVTLHAVNGPVHFVKDGRPYCHESHGCNLPGTTACST